MKFEFDIVQFEVFSPFQHFLPSIRREFQLISSLFDPFSQVGGSSVGPYHS